MLKNLLYIYFVWTSNPNIPNIYKRINMGIISTQTNSTLYEK